VARYGLNILKRCAFRLGIQHFGNTYYYEVNIGAGNLTDLNLLVDEVVAKEKAIHASTVTFVRARLWSQVGTQSQNNMLIDRNLSGGGGLSEGLTTDKERAVLIRFRAGNDSKGRPVYLRKWYHVQSSTIGGEGITNGELVQSAELSAVKRAAMNTVGNSLANFTVAGVPANLVSKGGRNIDGGTTVHRFYEHHQLGDEWRAA
jgi:hypothetical protein